MATGSVAADSSVVVTSLIAGRSLIDVATDVLGAQPLVWGRYFTGSATKNRVVYRPTEENTTLNARGIRLLPIARQTTRVGGSADEGSADGAMNAEAFVIAFGPDVLAAAGTEFLMFLDVEGPPHSLSREYYQGWTDALQTTGNELSGGRFALLPAIYATQADAKTWSVVTGDGAPPCAAAWVARWRVRGCSKPLDWKPAIVQPPIPIGCPVVMWQYADDCHSGDGIDCDEINPDPAIQSFLLERLLLPPGNPTGPDA